MTKPKLNSIPIGNPINLLCCVPFFHFPVPGVPSLFPFLVAFFCTTSFSLIAIRTITAKRYKRALEPVYKPLWVEIWPSFNGRADGRASEVFPVPCFLTSGSPPPRFYASVIGASLRASPTLSRQALRNSTYYVMVTVLDHVLLRFDFTGFKRNIAPPSHSNWNLKTDQQRNGNRRIQNTR